MALAALALLGQLWMGQVSTAHLARWLSAQYLHGDVCSVLVADASGAASVPVQDSDPMGHHGQGCPVCSVAGTGLAPASTAPAVPGLALQASRHAVPQPQAPRALPRGYARPPAQAPPAA